MQVEPFARQPSTPYGNIPIGECYKYAEAEPIILKTSEYFTDDVSLRDGSAISRPEAEDEVIRCYVKAVEYSI